jgi:hypothetical protein
MDAIENHWDTKVAAKAGGQFLRHQLIGLALLL